MSTRFARLLTLAGFFGLLAWVLLWHLWLSPHPDLNPWLLPVIWTVPLLFPLKGIVQGNPYTHAWGNFVLMPYFLHALTLITTDEGERWLAVVELVLTTLSKRAMPMIRYRTRDITAILTEPCACGRTLRRIRRISDIGSGSFCRSGRVFERGFIFYRRDFKPAFSFT